MKTEKPMTQTLAITGLRCDGCVDAVTRALDAVPGVERCSVDLETGIATILGTAPSMQLAAAVREAGFEA